MEESSPLESTVEYQIKFPARLWARCSFGFSQEQEDALSRVLNELQRSWFGPSRTHQPVVTHCYVQFLAPAAQRSHAVDIVRRLREAIDVPQASKCSVYDEEPMKYRVWENTHPRSNRLPPWSVVYL